MGRVTVGLFWLCGLGRSGVTGVAPWVGGEAGKRDFHDTHTGLLAGDELGGDNTRAFCERTSIHLPLEAPGDELGAAGILARIWELRRHRREH